MKNVDDEYNEYSNNIYHKNGKGPGLTGWLWIILQIIAITVVTLIYFIIMYMRENILNLFSGFRKHFVRTSLGVTFFFFLIFIFLQLLEAYKLIRTTDLLFFCILIATPLLVRFRVFDALSYLLITPEKGLSEMKD